MTGTSGASRPSPILPAQPFGAPVPPGYAGLCVHRDRGPSLFAAYTLGVDGHQVDLPAGRSTVACRPGRHRVTIHRSEGLVLAGTDVDVTPDRGATLLFVWSGWDGPTVHDGTGRDVTDPAIADPLTGGPPTLPPLV